MEQTELFQKLTDLGFCPCGKSYNEYWPGGKRPRIPKRLENEVMPEKQRISLWIASQQLICPECSNIISVGNYHEANALIYDYNHQPREVTKN